MELRDSELLDAYSRAVVWAVEKVGPAVVSIRGQRRGRFGTRAEGAGSGFVLAPDGYVATNSHVVHGADHLSVVFPDGSTFEARIAGDDPPTDLALLRIPTSGLPYLKVEPGLSLRAGQLVVAIGNPYGFDSTVSTGVLSAIDRTLPAEGRPLLQLLQHTAPLNPGNSGGPLVSSGGELMGVNTAIIPSAVGLGFAIPVQTLAWVIPRLMRDGHIVRGYLGITGRTDAVRPAWVARYGCSRSAVRVEGVETGSPAAQGGLERGDLLISLGAQPIESIATLHRQMAELAPGTQAPVGVLRRGERRELPVRFGRAGA
jgi:S1-C subfamily serine protease